MDEPEVFISYHGDSHGQSSYEMAERLKEFLETHPGRSFKCFLCRRENSDDFYDAINHALNVTEHFILVACDKNGLSDWVSDELKQFDGLRKTGKKTNALINAYIYGNIQLDDLISFNTVFSTKDIASGSNGFEKLYNMLIKRSTSNERVLSFNAEYKFHNIVSLCPLSFRFNETIKNIFLSEKFVNVETDLVMRRIMDDITVFECYISKQFVENILTQGDLLVLQVQNPTVVAEYIVQCTKMYHVLALLFDYNIDNVNIITDGKIIPVPSLKDISFAFYDTIIAINKNYEYTLGNITFTANDISFKLPKHPLNEYGEINYFTRKIGFDEWETKKCNMSNAKFCIFLLTSCYENIVPKGTKASEELADQLDFCKIEIPDVEDSIVDTEKFLIEQHNLSLNRNEYLLDKYYKNIKSGLDMKEEVKELLSSKYNAIAYLIRDYYDKHSSEIFSNIFSKLIEFKNFEKNQGSISRYMYLLIFIFQIYIHNIYSVKLDDVDEMELFEEIKSIYRNEYVREYRLNLFALICSFQKELLFGGKLGIGNVYRQEVHRILNDFETCICNMTQSSDTIQDNKFKDSLLLLYRERAVIWEQCGDSSISHEDRIAYYNRWKLDCEKAIEISKHFSCDKEVLGCVYLNLASSLNRLSREEKDPRTTLMDCLKNLDMAMELFKTSVNDRNIAYAYLHKSDCYEALLKLDAANEYFEFSKFAPLAKEIWQNSARAMNLFKDTDDNVAKCWALRLSIKGKLFMSSEANTCDNLRWSLKSINKAFHYCHASNYVNGMAECVMDLTIYINIIRHFNLTSELLEEIKSTFFDEMATFTSLLKMLELNGEDIYNLQKQTEKLVSKLIK